MNEKIDFVEQMFKEDETAYSERYWELLSAAAGFQEMDDVFKEIPDELEKGDNGDKLHKFHMLAMKAGFNAGFYEGFAQGVILGRFGGTKKAPESAEVRN